MNSKEKSKVFSPVITVIRIDEDDVIVTSTGKDNDIKANETIWK